MGIGGFFKKIWGEIRKVLPFLGKALDNPFIRMILVSKLGERLVEIIRELVRLADGMKELDKPAKHAYVRREMLARAPGIKGSELDTHIKVAVAEMKGEAEIQVPKGLA